MGEEVAKTTIDKQRFTDYYRWLIVAIGLLIVLRSIRSLPVERLDLSLLFLTAMIVITSLRFAIPIPRFDTNITISDAFIFLALLLYGREVAVLLAAAEGFCSGLRISKSRRPLTILFNSAAMACSTFATAIAVRSAFGDTSLLPDRNLPVTITMLCAMALVQFIGNTGLVAIGLALKNDLSILEAWYRNYLCSSLTYFIGAAIAGLIAYLGHYVGFYGLLISSPVVLILYLTYSKYLDDIRMAAAQAELAERQRAEFERQRAEQAERHVRELNRYIAQLEQTSRALKESREHFRYAAFHDALTGLPNRALFTDHVRLAIERAKRRPEYIFSVLFLDLDRFKHINDSLGYSFGDKLLVATARRLESCLRQADTVARFGGDEFAVLLDGIRDSSDAVRVAEKIQEALSAPFTIERSEAFITASIGIALSISGYDHPDEIIRDADIAMYRAKEGGKARYELFDKEMHSRAVARLKMENDLRRAIERAEFCLHYQPIVELETGKLVGFEALARWHHPERGLVSPAEFIPIAEETGMIVPIGMLILEEACRQMSVWQQQSPANKQLAISVNISSKNWIQSDFVARVESILARTGFPPHCLKLEVTESLVLENADAATTVFEQLRALGVCLSIDDFGTGYSSLSYLHRFPFDALKIDRSFISNMGCSDENIEIVRTITRLAQNLGMEVIAEGIETMEQVKILRALSCHYGQGYFFSKPLAACAAEELIRAVNSGERDFFALNSPPPIGSIENKLIM